MRKYTVRELAVGGLLAGALLSAKDDDLLKLFTAELGVDYFIQMSQVEESEENEEAVRQVVIAFVNQIKNGEFA